MNESLRKCIATGETMTKNEMMRFVVSPDGFVVFDAEEKLPGRGIWIKANEKALKLAIKKNAFSKTATNKVAVSSDLCVIVKQRLISRCMDIVGIAKKAGSVITGFEKVKAALKKNDNNYIMLSASDISDNQFEKIINIAGKSVVVIKEFLSADLSSALGRRNTMHVLIRKGLLADKLLKETERLQKYLYGRSLLFNEQRGLL